MLGKCYVSHVSTLPYPQCTQHVFCVGCLWSALHFCQQLPMATDAGTWECIGYMRHPSHLRGVVHPTMLLHMHATTPTHTMSAVITTLYQAGAQQTSMHDCLLG
jgi:hypothetical protein